MKTKMDCLLMSKTSCRGSIKSQVALSLVYCSSKSLALMNSCINKRLLLLCGCSSKSSYEAKYIHSTQYKVTGYEESGGETTTKGTNTHAYGIGSLAVHLLPRHLSFASLAMMNSKHRKEPLLRIVE
jgi:hypothetical protein